MDYKLLDAANVRSKDPGGAKPRPVATKLRIVASLVPLNAAGTSHHRENIVHQAVVEASGFPALGTRSTLHHLGPGCELIEIRSEVHREEKSRDEKTVRAEIVLDGTQRPYSGGSPMLTGRGICTRRRGGSQEPAEAHKRRQCTQRS